MSTQSWFASKGNGRERVALTFVGSVMALLFAVCALPVFAQGNSDEVNVDNVVKITKDGQGHTINGHNTNDNETFPSEDWKAQSNVTNGAKITLSFKEFTHPDYSNNGYWRPARVTDVTINKDKTNSGSWSVDSPGSFPAKDATGNDTKDGEVVLKSSEPGKVEFSLTYEFVEDTTDSIAPSTDGFTDGYTSTISGTITAN